MERKLERKLDLRSIRRSPTRMLLAGYLTVILIGTVLLMLPVSSREGIVTAGDRTRFYGSLGGLCDGSGAL